MMRVMIVDDEPFARRELATLLAEIGDCEICASCASAIEALRALNSQAIDLLFLDIQMPMIDGFELLSMIEPSRMPHVIFVTAYDEFALKAFEENTLDYLLKPVEKVRLEKTFEKFHNRIRLQRPPEHEVPALKHIPCMSGNRIKLICSSEVEAAHSDPNGVRLLLSDGDFYTDLTLKALTERTDLRHCHRQFLVNPDRIELIQLLNQGLAEIRTKSGRRLPVSRRYLKTLKAIIGL